MPLPAAGMPCRSLNFPAPKRLNIRLLLGRVIHCTAQLCIVLNLLQVLVDEKLADNAERQGQKLRQRLGELQRDGSRVCAIRGKVMHLGQCGLCPVAERYLYCRNRIGAVVK